MEERRDERRGLIVPGRYRTGSGMAVNVTLRDLSRGGCQIHDRLGRLSVEQFLTIRIGPVGPIDSRVRWLDGRVAGIRFNQPLADTVFDHICAIAEEAGIQPDTADTAEITEQGGKKVSSKKTRKLDLLDRERHYNELVHALDVNDEGEEILVGLDRKESDWLIRWRRELRAEREARANYRADKSRAERLEELHEQTRKNKLGY